MKRKILLLLALQSITILTLNETSCFCFRKKTEETSLVDISLKKLASSNAITNKELYLDVWTQIGDWADPAVTAADIKNDTEMGIEIWDTGNLYVLDSDSDDDLSIGPHQVVIEVKADDSYFQVQDEIPYRIEVFNSLELFDIYEKNFIK